MKKIEKLSLIVASLGVCLLLIACGNSKQDSSSSSQASSSQASSASSSSASSSSSQTSSANTSSSSSVAAPSDLDGTYKASHEGDDLTLTLSGNKGSLTKIERDGEQEIEQVEVDPNNQTMIIGDDVKRYYVNGNQLTIEDRDQELDDDDTVVYTKQ
ncbi:SP_0198 family lipoprotein [Streptococcus oricebi]|uniref:DUF3642 domain-containing protein n=1 Tax=Streptococcus oricebi TaxID=1547447 RepID=A0ABS5B558_9STRE|nr:SP_0198 family lipoprotein [Streptococcus oricebi]MBP2623940.1 hypothetical protein [Streptococcus oricebi]